MEKAINTNNTNNNCSSNYSNLLVNNNFVPITKTRPPFIKIEELDSETENSDKIFCTTEIDTFDILLYEKIVKVKTSKENKFLIERENNMRSFRYKNSKLLYDLDYDQTFRVEKNDVLSNRKPFMSVPGMGNMTLRSKFKMQLTKKSKVGVNKKGGTNKLDITLNDAHSNYSNLFGGNFRPSDKENRFFESVIRKSAISFQPTHMVKTEISKNLVSVNLKHLDKDNNNMKKVNDTLFNSIHINPQYRKSDKANTRPDFVNDLFNKYDYQDLDPWERKVQNRTKDKSLCVSVIQNIYYKLSNLFN